MRVSDGVYGGRFGVDVLQGAGSDGALVLAIITLSITMSMSLLIPAPVLFPNLTSCGG